MKLYNMQLKKELYYKELLERLTNSFELKYFDKRGLRGAVYQKGEVAVGISVSSLPKFDELCMELRNSILSKGTGTTPVN